MNVMMDLRMEVMKVVRVRVSRLKSLRMRVDQARTSVIVIITKEDGRVIAPMVPRCRNSPSGPPHSLSLLALL